MSSSSALEYNDGNISGSPAPFLRALPSPQELLEEDPLHLHHRLSSLSLSPQHSYPPGDRPVLPPLQPSPILSRRQSLSPIVQHPLPIPRAISSSPALSILPRPLSSYSIQQQVMPPRAAVPFRPSRSRVPYAPRVRKSPPGSVQ
ncbi:hypothetical protein BOTBODRAFT_33853 [Botryobasidium botryosum FD-172 SS1]|uniref:Uncharacterized protein n=1 Tax=Botryobasidium botryosum (strain FD-172 SS1) TaxID=930990 RepID=A0A067MNT5_BOTB1|nr:hypothetical protein BOTBODRAFT_33853 [Botryobasidium botryosum FD-172 SS1]